MYSNIQEEKIINDIIFIQVITLKFQHVSVSAVFFTIPKMDL